MKTSLKVSILLFLTFPLLFLPASGQSKKEYENAEALAAEANKKLMEGEVKIADSLINQSLNLYPTKAIFQYAKTLCRLSDIATANNVMDKAYQKVATFPSEKILVFEALALSIKDLLKGPDVKEYELARALFYFGHEAYLVNKEFGGIKRMEEILEKLVMLKFKRLSKLDEGFSQQQYFNIELALAKKEFDKAIIFVNDLPYNELTRNMYLRTVYFEKGDYDNALKVTESVNKSLKGGYKKELFLLKFKVNALGGNHDEALNNYQQYMNENPLFITNDVFYYLALIDLKGKEYRSALNNIDSAVHHRITGMYGPAEFVLVDRWKVYKLMGDAYAGMQQFEKAKNNYNISLLSNPDYEPAISAMASLESNIASNTATDKAVPEIILVEPSAKRGFKVTSTGTSAMIKGIATDPSGIKEVKINNKIVYAQKGGDFWGEVLLVEGKNRIVINAIDLAGNKAEQVFEIEKSTASGSITQGPEKEGKNYALLIAAQNYSDNNIPSLDNPVADAVKLKLILKNQYNFSEENIFTLFNPGVNDVKRQLLELTNTVQPEDNLVIFYAGHGIWVEKEKKGYWMLTDSKGHDANTWLPNKVVLDLIAKLPSRHTLLITDACFSGSVFKTRAFDPAAPVIVQQMNEKITRVAITSGNDTEVPDKSVFMKYLVKALTENKEKYLTAQKMFINQIIEAVMTETKTEPRYGTLELAGHIGGDYIFSKK